MAHKVFKLRDLDRHSKGYLLKVIVAGGSGLLLNVITDPFLGYFRNIYIFGQEYTCLLYTSIKRVSSRLILPLPSLKGWIQRKSKIKQGIKSKGSTSSLCSLSLIHI